ncbi:MAG: 2-isopropylmalate synthase, partial [Planctomycetota bacterium]
MSTDNKMPKYAGFPSINLAERKWPTRVIAECPDWCSVDLRDGNQALPNPMNPAQKMEYFKLLCDIGFKTIEIAFPSASQDDFDFTRKLIEEKLIPEDVFIMGLCQCRDHLIDKTFEAFKDIERGIVHLYIATSKLHMQQVFNMDEKATIERAVTSIRQVRELADSMPESDIRLEFSPEEFTDTDIDFAVEICEAVFDAWGKATVEKPIIMNLPATVERRPPNLYADMIEYFADKFSQRDKIKISVHSHNDQGMAVAGTELAVLAGADRVEGTLFGHGERTGNVDIVTFANNLFSRGIDIGLDFSKMDQIVETVEKLTGMPVYYRQPYSGEYVFTAFSGSHQDAIRKGISKRGENAAIFGMNWKVPYLHVDPVDLGRSFEGLIRINSQSGKGGIAWVLEQEYGVSVPKQMQPDIGAAVQHFSDSIGREVTSKEVWDVFEKEFINPEGPYNLLKYWPRPDNEEPTLIHGELKIVIEGEEKAINADGNGPVSAFVNCLRSAGISGFKVDDFEEEAIGQGADAKAMAYVPIKLDDGSTVWGVGTDTNIDQAAIQAIIAGLNRAKKGRQVPPFFYLIISGSQVCRRFFCDTECIHSKCLFCCTVHRCRCSFSCYLLCLDNLSSPAPFFDFNHVKLSAASCFALWPQLKMILILFLLIFISP